MIVAQTYERPKKTTLIWPQTVHIASSAIQPGVAGPFTPLPPTREAAPGNGGVGQGGDHAPPGPPQPRLHALIVAGVVPDAVAPAPCQPGRRTEGGKGLQRLCGGWGRCQQGPGGKAAPVRTHSWTRPASRRASRVAGRRTRYRSPARWRRDGCAVVTRGFGADCMNTALLLEIYRRGELNTGKGVCSPHLREPDARHKSCPVKATVPEPPCPASPGCGQPSPLGAATGHTGVVLHQQRPQHWRYGSATSPPRHHRRPPARQRLQRRGRDGLRVGVGAAPPAVQPNPCAPSSLPTARGEGGGERVPLQWARQGPGPPIASRSLIQAPPHHSIQHLPTHSRPQGKCSNRGVA